MYSPLKSLKVLPNVYVQFDLNSTLLHFQPVKVSLGVSLQGLGLNIVLFLDWCLSVSVFKACSFSINYRQGHQPACADFLLVLTTVADLWYFVWLSSTIVT